MEPWYVMMVEVPLQWVDSVRINNQCRLVILASYKPRNHKIWCGPGKSAGSSSFRISTGTTMSWHLNKTKGREIPKIPIWRMCGFSVYDGLYHGQEGRSKTPYGADQGPSEYKRVGMRGGGEGQWLAWVLYWAPYHRKYGRGHYSVSNKDNVSYG